MGLIHYGAFCSGSHTLCIVDLIHYGEPRADGARPLFLAVKWLQCLSSHRELKPLETGRDQKIKRLIWPLAIRAWDLDFDDVAFFDWIEALRV